MDVLAALIILVVFFLIYLYIPYYFVSFNSQKLINRIPGFPSIPIFGHILDLAGPRYEILNVLGKYYQKSEDIYFLNFLGRRYIFCRSLKYIEELMSSKKFITKSLDYEMLHSWLGTGLLTATGDKWFNHRKMFTPAFHFKILEDFIPSMTSNSKILVDSLKGHVDQVIDLWAFVTLSTLDVICETSMGTKINAQITQGDAPYVQAILKMSILFTRRQTSFWLYRPLAFFLSPYYWEQRKVLQNLHGFTDRIIKERRAEYRSKKHLEDSNLPAKKRKLLTFLDLMIEIAENDPTALTDEDIRDEVNTFMFEGHDTTAATLLFTCYCLGRNPEIQEAAFRELEDIFQGSDRDVTSEDLAKMKLLERIIKESLRLYPVVPMIGRRSLEETTIGEYTVPAETMFSIMPFWIHRDPKIYENPLKFDPDRFLLENIANRHPFAYLPFSAGPRNCIGQRFAMMEEKILISGILRNYKIESLDREEDLKLNTELILRPDVPLRTILRAREIS